MTEQSAAMRTAQPEAPAGRQRTAHHDETVPVWARGAIVFAGMMMIIAGAFQAITGMVGLFANEFYITTRQYLFQFDATSWGLIHLLVGALVLLAGFAVLAGQAWGQVAGIVLVAISALANFTFIPYYPFWSLTIIALDVFIIWALATHGRDVQN